MKEILLKDNLEPIFGIMQLFKKSLLNGVEPLDFIVENLCYDNTDLCYDNLSKDWDRVSGVVTNRHGIYVVEVDCDCDYKNFILQDCQYYNPNVYINYKNFKPMDLTFSFWALPNKINKTFVELGKILNKENFQVRNEDFLIDVVIEKADENFDVLPLGAFAQINIQLKIR